MESQHKGDFVEPTVCKPCWIKQIQMMRLTFSALLCVLQNQNLGLLLSVLGDLLYTEQLLCFYVIAHK